jgi:hypothetical protein
LCGGVGLVCGFPGGDRGDDPRRDGIHPQPEAQQVYERLYKEVYLRMYRQLKPLYQSIRKITGYPA